MIAEMWLAVQGTLPCLTPEGKIIMASGHTMATAPDGNGGVFTALKRSALSLQVLQPDTIALQVQSVNGLGATHTQIHLPGACKAGKLISCTAAMHGAVACFCITWPADHAWCKALTSAQCRPRSGALKDMASKGVACVDCVSVDNALVRPADPLFLGLCHQREAECGECHAGRRCHQAWTAHQPATASSTPARLFTVALGTDCGCEAGACMC